MDEWIEAQEGANILGITVSTFRSTSQNNNYVDVRRKKIGPNGRSGHRWRWVHHKGDVIRWNELKNGIGVGGDKPFCKEYIDKRPWTAAGLRELRV